MILLFMLFILLIIDFAVINYSIHRDIRDKENELNYFIKKNRYHESNICTFLLNFRLP